MDSPLIFHRHLTVIVGFSPGFSPGFTPDDGGGLLDGAKPAPSRHRDMYFFSLYLRFPKDIYKYLNYESVIIIVFNRYLRFHIK